LVGRGLPFREAHHCVGALVHHAAEQGKPFGDLTLEEFQRFSPLFGLDALAITTARSLGARSATGGTAPAAVAARLDEARRRHRERAPFAIPAYEPARFVPRPDEPL
jgi:argininosuccinate lyase